MARGTTVAARRRALAGVLAQAAGAAQGAAAALQRIEARRLRYATVKAVHQQQVQGLEEELVEALAPHFQRCLRSAAEGLAELVGGMERADKGYDPSQPRDDAGRWSAGGGGAAAVAAPPVRVTGKAEYIAFVDMEAGMEMPNAEADFKNTARIIAGTTVMASLLHACGVPETAEVMAATDGHELRLEYTDSTLGVHGARVITREQGQVHIHNEELVVEKRGAGVGTQLLHQQVQGAASLGAVAIHLTAAGDAAAEAGAHGYNGYYTWARLGFDARVADLPKDVQASIAAAHPTATHVSSLMSTPEGRAWWRGNGKTWQGRFDLAPNSLSRRVLDGYVAARWPEGAGAGTAAGGKAAAAGGDAAGAGAGGRRNPGRGVGHAGPGGVKAAATLRGAEALVRQVVDLQAWHTGLVDAALPPLFHAAGTAALVQLAEMGVDPHAGRSKAAGEGLQWRKASSASEWLAENASPDELPAQIYSGGAGGGMARMGFAWAWPRWLKRVVSTVIENTFRSPYWRDVSEAAVKALAQRIRKGLVRGLSITEVAAEIMADMADWSEEWSYTRARMVARTEAGNAMNGARKESLDHLRQVVPQLAMVPVWLSVLAPTTRDTHAALDGVPANPDGLWALAGQLIPWPGYHSLPAGERCNCLCTVIMEYGMDQREARELIQAYVQRANQREAQRLDSLLQGQRAYNPQQPRDSGGRWTSGGGSGSAPAAGAGATRTENEAALQGILQTMAGMRRGNRPEGWRYGSTEELVLEHGQWQQPAPRPKGIRKEQDKQCFANATRLALAGAGTYCEGYALPDMGIAFPIHHAWVVDGEGRVIDNTWKDPGLAYLGVPLSTSFVSSMAMRTGVYGVFGNYIHEAGQALLRDGLPQGAVEGGKAYSPLGLKYNPNQPRDAYGRWATSGGVPVAGQKPYVGKAGAYDSSGNPIPGKIGQFAGLDTSSWPAGHYCARWALGKIHKMEGHAAAGEWDKVVKASYTPKASTEMLNHEKPYIEGVWQAEANLLALKGHAVAKDAGFTTPPTPAEAGGYTYTGKSWGPYDMPVYRAADGSEWAVREPFGGGSDTAAREVLAATLFRAAGGNAPAMRVVPDEDGYLMVGIDANTLLTPGTNDGLMPAADDVVLHAWLGNLMKPYQDNAMAGLGGNMSTNFSEAELMDGLATTVSPKAHLKEIMQHPAYAGVPLEAQVKSAMKLTTLPSDQIEAIVNASGIPEGEKAKVAARLVGRADVIANAAYQQAAALGLQVPQPGGGMGPPPAAKPSPLAKAMAATAVSIAPHYTAKTPAAVVGQFEAIYAAAKAGDVAAVQAVATKNNKSYWPRMAYEYQQRVLAAMKAGAKPPTAEAPAPKPKPKVETSKLPTAGGKLALSMGDTYVPPKVDVDKLPSGGIGLGLTMGSSPTVATEVAKVKAMAAAGDLAGLANKAQEHAKVGGVLGQWTEATYQAVAYQLDPPTAARPLDVDETEFVGKLLARPTGKESKVGYWAAVHTQPGVPRTLLERRGVALNKEEDSSLHSLGHMSYQAHLSPKEKSAVREYTGGDYEWMNDELRKGNPSKAAATAALAVDKASVTLPEGKILYRKYLSTGIKVAKHATDMKPGMVLADGGLLSTSTSATAWPHGRVKMKITLGPGVRGLPAEKFTQNTKEREVILPVNQRLLIRDVRYDSSSLVMHVDALALPYTPEQTSHVADEEY